MKTPIHSSSRRIGRDVLSRRLPAQPQFKIRLLTLAILSAYASAPLAAGNRAPAPVNALPTGGGVLNPGTATINGSVPHLLQINQTAPKTTINWKTFDIAQGNTVHFNQPSASAEAINYIGGHNPSVIQGTLSANGKVYLVNANGILFDGTAQVNVNTLIASSLNISQSTFDNGITSSLVGKTGPTLVATMVLNTAGQVVNYGTLRSVSVDPASGEVITAPKVDAKTGLTAQQPVAEGGAIMLFAPQVENHGIITANNGQVILAAGKSVYLQLYNDPTLPGLYNATDLSMRGLIVKVTAAAKGSLDLTKLIATQKLNSVANIGGEIRSDRGNTTLIGMMVNQSGRISANTATTVNGSIWLKAENYDAASKQTTYGGTRLTTSADSVTEVQPEKDDTTLAESAVYTDNRLYRPAGYQGVIKLLGQTVVHQGQAWAPGGRIVLGKEYVEGVSPTYTGRVYLGSNSVLSVAGLWTDLPYSDNYLTFKLGSLDLSNAPLQKGGLLINQTVTVDKRLPSPLLFDIAEKIDGVQRSVLEKATNGGAITVNTGEFITARNAKVDVSGGGYRYANGLSTKTSLIYHGRIYDIATAPINLQYEGVQTKTARMSGYIQGKNAGLLAIDAKQIIFGGNFYAGVTNGPYQRTPGALPALGKLVLGTQAVSTVTPELGTILDGTPANSLDILTAEYALRSAKFGASAATRQQLADALAVINADPDKNAPIPDALLDQVLLPADLFGGTAYRDVNATMSQGFGTLALRANNITVPQDVSLDLGALGSLFWLAPHIDVAGAVKAQGGSLTFNKFFENAVYGNTHLGPRAVLSTAGGWINDVGSVVIPEVNVIQGGSVNIQSDSTLDAGSLIDASGGALLNSSRKLIYGNGGGITLSSLPQNGVSLRAYGGKHGGTLDITGDTINVGGHSGTALSANFFTQGGFSQYTLTAAKQINFKEDIHPLAYRRLAKTNALLSPTGTSFADISTVASNMSDYLRTPASLSASTGVSASTTFQLAANETGITVDPGVSIRTDPLGEISLTSQTRLNVLGSLYAPAGKISLTLGPGDGIKFFYDIPSGSFNKLNIGSQAVISTAGVFLPSGGPLGLTPGQVLPGGTVKITAKKNDLDIAPGAIIDVSGTRHVVDLAPTSGRSSYLHANVASEGGSINIKATENAYLDGTFKGSGGDASVAGGSFTLELLYNGAYLANAKNFSDVLTEQQLDTNAATALAAWDTSGHQLKHTIIVSQTAIPLSRDGSPGDSSLIRNLMDGRGNFVAALRANISADQLVNGVAQGGTRVGGGFDSVRFKSDNQIQFNAGVNNFAPRALLHLDTPELLKQGGGTALIGSGAQNGTSWQTAQINLYNTPSDFRRSTFLPQPLINLYSPLLSGLAQIPIKTEVGSGELSLTAKQISLAGYVTVNGAADLNLLSSGDLRFEGFPIGYIAPNSLTDPDPLTTTLRALTGRLSSASNITLQANQIYPATAVNFTVAVENVSINQLSQDTAGNVTASASRNQVSEGKLSVKNNASAGDLAPVLSAGGLLTLQADHIDQAGILKAPLGHIALEGGQTLTLESGSITSVSALWQHGGVETELVIPYGASQNAGQSLWYASTQTLAAPAKQITASAKSVTVAPGATLDIRGGGDIAAMEFIPGIGGSKDVLAAANTYAIMPGVLFQTSDSYLNHLAPVGVSGATAYTTVHLGAGAGLPEGDYALLPAYYALLPGAYLVKTQISPAYSNLNPGYAATQLDGSVVVAGKLGYSGTGISQSTWSGFSIQSGADALTRTTHSQGEYRVTGSQFFADQAAKNNTAVSALPQDGGRLSVGATSSLVFEGNLLAAAAVNKATGGYGAIGQMDIYGSKFAIVNHTAAAPSGYTTLQSDQLSRLQVSLLVGGKRTDTPNGQSLDVVASDVLVDLNGGELKLPELWLAATDQLTVTGDSTLTAAGTTVSRSGTLTVNPDSNGKQYGALLGLSSGQLVPIARPGTLDTSPVHGNLTVETGAKLNAVGGSVAVDSTGTPKMNGVIVSDTLALGARRIALGAVPQNSQALVLGSAQLAALGSANNFVLRSYSGIDLYGAVNLGQVGSGSFTLDSAGLVGHDINGASAPVQLSAKLITLQNLSGTQLATNDYGNGTGSLTLAANKVVLGKSGTAGFTVAGFQRVDVNAGELSLQGSGKLNVAADLNIESARISAGGQQADQKISAYDASQQTWHALKVTQPGNAASILGASTDTLLPGGKLQLAASSVDFGGNIVLKSGRVTLAAHGATASDGVILKTGSRIDLSSYEKTFAQSSANLTESASAGRLTLSSEHGSVNAQSGSVIDLKGGAVGGDAGVLTVAAANGGVALDGTLLASATSGQKSGSVSIDAANLANFSSLNAALQTATFNQRRYLRARSGDINVASTDLVSAQNVHLVADAGTLNVRGTIDASSLAGKGEIQLDGGQGIHLFGTSKILANGISDVTGVNAAYSDGGKVGLFARNGRLDFDSGAVINVSANAAGKSSGGKIVFSAPRTASGDSLQATLAGQVVVSGGTVSVPGGRPPAAGNVIIEGFRSYNGIQTTSTASSATGTVYNDYDTFMNATATMQSTALGTLVHGTDVSSANLKIRAGIELVSASNSDLTVDTNWNLTDSSWLRTGDEQTAGRLALRAEGNLKVNARLGLPNESSIPPDAGWSLQLAGGADLASADALAVKTSITQGDITLNSNGKVATSTGDIEIAAGRDFTTASPASVVYTTGRAVALPILSADPALAGKYFAPSAGVNFVEGGSIAINAMRDITGSGGYANVNDWLRRNSVVPGSNILEAQRNTIRGFAYQPAYWWVDRLGNSRALTKGIEGIATLGGGDINIIAGNTVKNISTASATSRSATTTATLQYVNNRNNIPSENAVYGGGDVHIDAGGDLRGGQYLVGRGAASFTAGGDIGGINGLADSGSAPAFWLMGWSDDSALRGAKLQVEALGGVTLGSVANPTISESLKNAGTTISNTTVGYRGSVGFFFSYAPEDSVAVKSVGGDLVIAPAGEKVGKNVLPPRFSAVALGGNVSSGASSFDAASPGTGGHYQFPDSNGQFVLLAGGAVHDFVLSPHDYDPASLPTAGNPTNPTLALSDFGPIYKFPLPETNSTKLVTPSTLPGYRYAVVAETGDVSNAAFYFPQRSVVAAGQDIANVQLDLQNLLPTDVSYVAAARDFYYSNVLSNKTQWSTLPHLQIAGPGNLLVEAGRNINLGAVITRTNANDADNVTRIDAIGNKNNAALPTAGAATITLWSGVTPGSLSLAQVESLFSVLRSVGQFQDLLGQVQSNTLSGEAAIADANQVIHTANQAITTLFAGRVQPGTAPLFEPLIGVNGKTPVGQLTGAYNGALAAANNVIAALFKDGKPHLGDITLYNARISSDTSLGGSGGTLNLLAPYGDINVGLPTANSERNIGIFTSAGGGINAYLSGDLNVNLSKVATFQGGDILAYTSGVGSILDAGRGSRSSRSGSPPRQVAEKAKDAAGNPLIDRQGQPIYTGKVLYLPPADTSGRGFRTVGYDPDGLGPLLAPDPGKVYLLAPDGIIDAGEAGVSSASGLVVVALVVKNADNFSASGSSVGVPSVSSAPSAAPVSSGAEDANKAADAVAQSSQHLADASKDADFKSFRPALISVEVLGFGNEDDECSSGNPAADAACRKRKQQKGGN